MKKLAQRCLCILGTSDLSNYFGTPQGESIFDQLIAGRARSRTNSNSARDFQVETNCSNYESPQCLFFPSREHEI
jgi:hypothetical protein